MKILLADDHGLFRDSLAVWLQQYHQQIEVIFAIDWSSLKEQLNNSLQLILLDLGMPGMQGAASISSIKKILPDTAILVVSANENPATILACQQAGASGYITKSSSGKIILSAVEAVLKGNHYFPNTQSKNIKAVFNETLSKKQIQLLAHLAKGESNKCIAKTMFLSEGTVKQYVSQLLKILEVDNRTQAGNKARKILGIGS